MPKTRNTRKERAAKLRTRIARGPAWHTIGPTGLSPDAVDEAARQYRLWVEAWILDDLDDLVPELNMAKKGRAP